MRLLSLDLERYGPFTGRRLDFRPDARVHVVLGPNEAGKSCALAAVTDLLFGIEERTRFAFLHEPSELWLGAEIAARDGRRLGFRRRKGRKNLLTDSAGAPIPDDALAGFLGGLSRPVFCNAFGLDAGALRSGGEEMLRSDGEVGASLFAAASGLRGLRDTARQLDEEAGQIYVPQGRLRVLNQLVARYDEARKALSADRVGTEAWRSLNAEVESAIAEDAGIAERRRANAAEAARLRRLRTAAPILHRLAALAGDLDAFGGLVAMEPGAVEDLGRLREAQVAAAERLAEAEAARARAQAERDGIARDPEALALAEEVEELVRGAGDHGKSLRDLPRIEGEAAEFAESLRAIAIRLGLPDAQAVAAAQPSDMVRIRIRKLIAQGRERGGDLDRARAEQAQRQAELRDLQEARAGRAPAFDPAPFRERFETLAPVLREARQRDELAAEIRREEAALEDQVRRLSPAPASLTALAAAALPGPETLRRLAEERGQLERRRERVREVLDTASAERETLGGRIARRRADGALPDRAALLALRAARDGLWPALRAAALGQADTAREGETEAFGRMLTESDALADRLAQEAGRVAEQAADAEKLAAAERAAERAGDELSKIEAVFAAWDTAWHDLWQPAGLAPLPPAEMAVWLAQAGRLIERATALHARRAEQAALAARLEALRAPLLALAADLDLPGLSDLDVALVGTRLAERLRLASERWEAAREDETRLRFAEQALARAEAARLQAEEVESAWRAEWAAALPALSLQAQASREEAEAALDAWDRVPALIREQANRAGRVAGMRRDIRHYEDEARRLLAALLPGADLSIPEGVRRLQGRIQAAREAQVRHETLERNLAARAKARDEAADALALVESRQQALLLRYGFPPEEDVAALHVRLARRAALQEAVVRAREELARIGDGVPEETLRAELDVLPPDAIEGRLTELAEEEQRLVQDGKEAYARQRELEAQRRRIEGGTGAEKAAAVKRSVEAELREAARRYVVLRLGGLLLRSAIERHRAGQQDPLLARAAELFSGLTGGAFVGLDQDFNEDDQPVLRGRRAGSDRPVAVEAMSEGTRDQLFLALRLAYLEDFARNAEPAPFVGDDIFASFDDTRTGHGLDALAAIGETVQPILFTHHARLAEIAQARLGAAVDVVPL